jgi:hypothetical protein
MSDDDCAWFRKKEEKKKKWYAPSWRSRVPPTTDDVLGHHVHLAFNWCIDRGYCVGGAYDSESYEMERVSDGWQKDCKNGRHTLTLFHGSQRRGDNQQSGFWFPNDKWEEFFRWLAIDIANINKMPLFYNQIVCNPTKVCRFTMDFDLKAPKPESEKNLLRMLSIAHRVVCRYRPGKEHELEVVGCRNSPTRIDPIGGAQAAMDAKKFPSYGKMKERNGGVDAKSANDVFCYIDEHFESINFTLYSQGLHPYWNLYCNVEEALQMRESILFELQKEMPRPKGANKWPDVLDIAPMESGNLRMVGCYKAPKCIICKQWKAIADCCPGCYGAGKVNDMRAYLPFVVLRGPDATVDQAACTFLMNNTYELLKRCSLHLPEGTTKSFSRFKIPHGEPRYIPKTRENTFTRNAVFLDGRKGEVVYTGFAADIKGVTSKPTFNVHMSADDERWEHLERFIQTTMPVQYQNIRINNIVTNKSAETFIIRISGPGANYCANVKRDHNSNHIYFLLRLVKMKSNGSVIKKAFIYQKCYSKKHDCPKYESEPYEIDPVLQQRIFPSTCNNSNASASSSLLMAASSFANQSSSLPSALPKDIFGQKNEGIEELRGGVKRKLLDVTPVPAALPLQEKLKVARMDMYLLQLEQDF